MQSLVRSAGDKRDDDFVSARPGFFQQGPYKVPIFGVEISCMIHKARKKA